MEAANQGGSFRPVISMLADESSQPFRVPAEECEAAMLLRHGVRGKKPNWRTSNCFASGNRRACYARVVDLAAKSADFSACGVWKKRSRHGLCNHVAMHRTPIGSSKYEVIHVSRKGTDLV